MNNPTPHIAVVGGLNMDLVVHVPVIPRPGETITGTSFATFPGGKGANQAVALARLGAQVTMIGQVGQDDFGKALLQNIRLEGINADQVGIDPDRATGVALITVEDSGQNNISVASGANAAVMVDHVRQALNSLERIDLLVLPLEVPLDAILAAVQTAKGRGAKVVLNPAPAQKLPAVLLRQVDVLAPNEFEAAILTGVEISDEASAREAAAMLSEWIDGSVVITLGGRGCLALDASQDEPHFYTLPAHQVEVVDTTAAGDAFVAGLAVGLGEGLSLREAAALGNAAGAISVTRPGAQPSLPRRSEVDSLLK